MGRRSRLQIFAVAATPSWAGPPRCRAHRGPRLGDAADPGTCGRGNLRRHPLPAAPPDRPSGPLPREPHRSRSEARPAARRSQIEGLRRLEIPGDMQKKYGLAPLGPADGRVKSAIFAGNTARLLRLRTAAARRACYTRLFRRAQGRVSRKRRLSQQSALRGCPQLRRSRQRQTADHGLQSVVKSSALINSNRSQHATPSCAHTSGILRLAPCRRGADTSRVTTVLCALSANA